MSASTPASSKQPHRRQTTKGTFEGQWWYCDCNPPLQAAFLQVKKPGRNKGRWFYTCAKPQDSQCSFFLFEDEANAIKKKALQEKSGFNSGAFGPRSPKPAGRGAETPFSQDVSMTAEGPIFSQSSSVFPTPAPGERRLGRLPPVPDSGWSSDEDSEGTAAGRREHSSGPCLGVASPASKRKRPLAEGEDAERPAADKGESGTAAGPSDLGPNNVDMTVETANQSDRVHQSQQPQLSQSQQSQRSKSASDSPATPSGRSTRLGFGVPQTPTSGNSSNAASASEPGTKRFKTNQGLPASTPSSARKWGGGSGGQPQGANDFSEDDAEITTAVLGLLKAESVSAPVRRAVRETLNLHALRCRGVERGRDVLREGLKKKDQLIAELQARVAKLEGERQTRRELLRRAASNLEEALSQESRDD
ncbi:uncharacterized protein THITE_2120979 [Thermothielavioides terrestris NRRL 8126]|uniref:GRF-type domain-containing protein n=2 Tax=Thermothielavioides terrestris TaxID=2587410 RepID=G2RE44_THETT|nr:uncharacterized protein THITE_2120979 [Thermothielavioides terrestris NRRL 8126]AEO70071.1 hypothetical protein THITE_2120979 [Thermothielavioides terrestris NRRL 8126]